MHDIAAGMHFECLVWKFYSDIGLIHIRLNYILKHDKIVAEGFKYICVILTIKVTTKGVFQY